jgi:Uma2 family endonuclease
MSRNIDEMPPAQLTVEDYERLEEPDEYRSELVRGVVVREPLAGPYHGRTQTRLARRLDAFAEESGLGAVFTEVGVILSRQPATVRGPDVMFYRSERVPRPLPRSFFEIPPDLAVEVVAPSNSFAEILTKVAEYLNAGTDMVWVIDPIKRTAVVYQSGDEIRLLSESDSIDGGNVLADLDLPLTDVLP